MGRFYTMPTPLTEQDIHAGLIDRCTRIIQEMRNRWSPVQKDSTAIAWAGEDIEADDGQLINDAVLLELPEDRRRWRTILSALVGRTKAFGLLVVDRTEDGFTASFETRHGSRKWTLKKERHGDAYVLSSPTVLDDVETTGLLWTPSV